VLLSGEVRADTQNPTPKEGRPFYNVWFRQLHFSYPRWGYVHPIALFPLRPTKAALDDSHHAKTIFLVIHDLNLIDVLAHVAAALPRGHVHQPTKSSTPVFAPFAH
jgi:hypothetical protein